MMGAPGASVGVLPELAGLNCVHGGVRLTSAGTTAFVCNGAPGDAGPAGQGVSTMPEPAGTNCLEGGVAVTSAIGTQYVCNGRPGDAGPPGVLLVRTVLVAAGANPTSNGAALLGALAGLTDAGVNSPFVVKVEPGVFDVGTSTVPMRAFVDVEGSGPRTVIRGTGSSTIRAASHSELRWLAVENSGASTADPAPGALDDVGSTNFSLRGVTVSKTSSSGAAVAFSTTGLRLRVTDSRLFADSTDPASNETRALSCTGCSGVFERVEAIAGSDGDDSYGVFIFGTGAGGLTLKETEASSTRATSQSVGIQVTLATARIRGGRYEATNTVNRSSYGMQVSVNTDLIASDATFSASASGTGASYGVSTFDGVTRLSRCEVSGTTNSIRRGNGAVSASFTRLSGPVFGAATCAYATNGADQPFSTPTSCN
jgi:hypothetical protein